MIPFLKTLISELAALSRVSDYYLTHTAFYILKINNSNNTEKLFLTYCKNFQSEKILLYVLTIGNYIQLSPELKKNNEVPLRLLYIIISLDLKIFFIAINGHIKNLNIR